MRAIQLSRPHMQLIRLVYRRSEMEFITPEDSKKIIEASIKKELFKINNLVKQYTEMVIDRHGIDKKEFINTVLNLSGGITWDEDGGRNIGLQNMWKTDGIKRFQL